MLLLLSFSPGYPEPEAFLDLQNVLCVVVFFFLVTKNSHLFPSVICVKVIYFLLMAGVCSVCTVQYRL